MPPPLFFTNREEGYSMYDTRTVRNSMRYLYRGAVHEHGYKPETVNALLREVDCAALAAVFRRAAHRVYAFETRGRHPLPPLYRGKDLFGQRAVRIYEDVDAFTSGLPSASHALEVWTWSRRPVCGRTTTPASTTRSTGKFRATPGAAAWN